MEVYVYEKFLKKIKRATEALQSLVSEIQNLSKEINNMSVEFEALKAQVEANTQVAESAITLIQGLAAKIEELKDDPAALQALADQLKAEDDALAAAVAANTPAPPAA